jgi:cation diffusion facilitator family transporter
VIYAAVQQIRAGTTDPPHYLTVLGALVSVIYNYLMYRFASCVGLRVNSPAIMADAFENRTDAISSVACIVGIIAALLIHPVCDAIAALAVGGVILHNSIEQLREATAGLMDAGLPADRVADIERRVLLREEVARIVYLRSRQIGAGFWVDLGVELEPRMTLKKAAGIALEIEREVGARNMVTHAEVYVFPSGPAENPEQLSTAT